MRFVPFSLLSALLIVLVMVPVAVAQDTAADAAAPAGRTSFRYRGIGPRLGLTMDPDQFHLGAHAEFGPFAQRGVFRPNVEIGFGNDITLVAVNLEGAYRFNADWGAWTPYAGGGLGLNFISWDAPAGVDGSDTDLGFNLLAGVEYDFSTGKRLLLELKLGLADSPDVKITAGLTFF